MPTGIEVNVASAPRPVQKALAYLVDHELVEKAADGRYRVADPFLRQWILDAMKPAH